MGDVSPLGGSECGSRRNGYRVSGWRDIDDAAGRGRALPLSLPLLDAVFPLLKSGTSRHRSRQERQIVQSSKDLRHFLP